MKQFSVLTLAFIAFFHIFGTVYASCSISLNSPSPKVVSHFGTKNVLLGPKSVITRELRQTVDLYCVNGFTCNEYSNVFNEWNSHIQLICGNEGFSYHENVYQNNINTLKCVDHQSSQMYESKTSLPHCKNFMTLVVGFDFENHGTLKYVAICYDLSKKQIKYISYTAYPTNLIESTQEGQLKSLGLDVSVTYTDDIFIQFSSLDIKSSLRNDKQLSELFGEETYEYENLIQDTAFTDKISYFNNMLSIIWLRGLRSGNWRHLLNALNTANIYGKYDVTVGVSGILNLPMIGNCNETRKLIIKLDNGATVSVPVHIWAHIRPITPIMNATDEFVVIGHNSPFITSGERDVLCKSMCQEINWLRDSLFIKLQDYLAFGLVQCCRVSDVAKKLDNFPNINNTSPTFQEEQH